MFKFILREMKEGLKEAGKAFLLFFAVAGSMAFLLLWGSGLIEAARFFGGQ